MAEIAKTADHAMRLIHPAGQKHINQPAQGVGHVVKTDIQRHTVILRLTED